MTLFLYADIKNPRHKHYAYDGDYLLRSCTLLCWCFNPLSLCCFYKEQQTEGGDEGTEEGGDSDAGSEE